MILCDLSFPGIFFCGCKNIVGILGKGIVYYYKLFFSFFSMFLKLLTILETFFING